MITFHYSYLILILGFLLIPTCVYRMSGVAGSDQFGIGALFGFFIGTIGFLGSVIAFLLVRHL